MLLEDKNCLIVFEDVGIIEIVSIQDWRIVQSFKLSPDFDIRDAVKLYSSRKYALALSRFEDGTWKSGCL